MVSIFLGKIIFQTQQTAKQLPLSGEFTKIAGNMLSAKYVNVIWIGSK
jgi:hypothetical protein